MRALNKAALPFLVGTKYDVFYALDHADQVRSRCSSSSSSSGSGSRLLMPSAPQVEITTQARKFAKAMKAPLIFCSVREDEGWGGRGTELRAIILVFLPPSLPPAAVRPPWR